MQTEMMRALDTSAEEVIMKKSMILHLESKQSFFATWIIGKKNFSRKII